MVHKMVNVRLVHLRTRLAFVSVVVLVGGFLPSCAAPEPFVPQAMPSEFDQDITTLLPLGPHKISLEDTFWPKAVKQLVLLEGSELAMHFGRTLGCI